MSYGSRHPRPVAKPAKKRCKERAPRIRVPDQERALFHIAGSPFVGVLRTLSLSGGSAILSRGPIQPGTAGGITLKTVFGKVTGDIEFLQMFADRVPLAQAFRFVTMDDASSKRLALAARNMEDEGYSDKPGGESTNDQDGLGGLLRSVRQLAAGLMPRKISKAKLRR